MPYRSKNFIFLKIQYFFKIQKISKFSISKIFKKILKFLKHLLFQLILKTFIISN